MSHDIFVQAHLNGGWQQIPTEEVLACFAPFIKQREDTFVDLEFDEYNSSTLYFEATRPTRTGFMLNRPCGDERLFECVFKVMHLGNFVLYEGGPERFIVLKEETIAHMPKDMVEALGEANITPDFESFMDAYRKGWDALEEGEE
jgi:hypothetical protein